jgi:hypothetical protein
MGTDLESLYQQIVQTIDQSIPERWQSASVDILIQDTVVTASGTYIAQRDCAEHSFPVVGSLNRMFMEMRQIIKKDNQNLWSTAHFTVNNKGKFTVEFGYSDKWS